MDSLAPRTPLNQPTRASPLASNPNSRAIQVPLELVLPLEPPLAADSAPMHPLQQLQPPVASPLVQTTTTSKLNRVVHLAANNSKLLVVVVVSLELGQLLEASSVRLNSSSSQLLEEVSLASSLPQVVSLEEEQRREQQQQLHQLRSLQEPRIRNIRSPSFRSRMPTTSH